MGDISSRNQTPRALETREIGGEVNLSLEHLAAMTESGGGGSHLCIFDSVTPFILEKRLRESLLHKRNSLVNKISLVAGRS